MRDVLTAPGVSFLAADPTCSCAVLGATDAAAETRIRDFARAAGLPDSAVRIERQEQFKPAWNLRDGIRPIKGGLQINNGAGGLCTMFGTVFHRTRQAKGLLTNSHCSTTRSALDGTEFFQAGGVIGDFVAREVIDPSSFAQSTNPRCPTGAVCRLSDALFAQFDTSTVGVVGRIARTANPCFSGTCNVEMLANDPHQFLPVTGADDGSITTGTRVSKIGRTTGWTVGTVAGPTCRDIPVADPPPGSPPIVMICQTVVTGTAGRGDSGSPVFTSQAGFTNAQYVGILWGIAGAGAGATFTYSPLSGVEAELGAFDYF
jgi:hypothetical protein